MKDRKAKEQETIEEIIAGIPEQLRYVESKFKRLRHIRDFPSDALVLDVGAAQGGFIAVCHKLGYRGYGIEPWDEARDNARRLSEYLSIPINIVEGMAENIPFDDESFDIVHANSENVLNLVEN